MSKIIDGKVLADKLGESLKEKLSQLKERPLVVSILIGSDPNSLLYTQMKQKKAEEFNIDFLPMKFSVKSSFENVAKKIHSLNETDEVKGIMIQLPIPKEFLGKNSKWDLIGLIDPKKDIDGMIPNSHFVSATVKGVIKIIEDLRLKTNDLRFGVVGSEGEVGKPLVHELSAMGVKEVIRLDKRNPECDMSRLKRADVVISCTGVKGLVDAEMVKKGVIAIDVGLGDFDEDVYKKAKMYTPKFGGVGPLTIISLMENILEACE
ncbi:MAG TPA: bifunctional 5,10-methylenetetrahydrofolate dehydrogenase/5,10-methenyltetrahydrofolate cyclohydrolase [Patescibacteria group bacterium]|nr:bifunctional 5,10-methylenetetrahydrofolate dehydrogenase/5,10-methenyltetrahydrofolate cyclohydrolase [Patescibacteria group bacterium]